jgi:3-deoxy-manno-octulosonate cytidylyltransferase (CMP-KDO synthetase)
MNKYIIIPAHLESKRLPKKLMLKEHGEHLIQTTVKNVIKGAGFHPFIATNSYVIRKLFPPEQVILTGRHTNGTSRVLEAAETLKLKPDDLIINVQGDRPNMSEFPFDEIYKKFEIETRIRDDVGDLLAGNLKDIIVSAYYESNDADVVLDSSRVKVALGAYDRALYFSRKSIPWNAPIYKIHIGIYAYRLSVLQRLCTLPTINKCENLEQMAWIENLYRIFMIKSSPVISIDTRKDYDEFKNSGMVNG